MRTRTTAAWEELLRGAEVPHAPVWSYADLFTHPEMSQRLRLTVRDPAGRPVDLAASPFHITGATTPARSIGPAAFSSLNKLPAEAHMGHRGPYETRRVHYVKRLDMWESPGC
jgi:crotonobetainyl-CoA:carnitine CoA-transferase CaiB-like acyl-CoA transferase